MKECLSADVDPPLAKIASNKKSVIAIENIILP
jgi:hypothetical protein